MKFNWKDIFKTATFSVFAVGLIAVFAITAFIKLPETLYSVNNAKTTESVKQLNEQDVCFTTPHVDEDLSNDEEFGAVKSPTLTNSYFAFSGLASTSEFKGLKDEKLTAPVQISEDDGSLSIGYSNEKTPMVFAVNFKDDADSNSQTAAIKSVTTNDGDLKGLAILSCPKPATEFWFIGPATTLKDTAVLQLANVTPSTSEVTISVWGSDEKTDLADDGSLKYVGERTFGVSAKTEQEVILTAGAPNQDVIALQVKAAYAPIAATIITRTLDGLAPNGVEFANSLIPSKSLTIPGVEVKNPDEQKLNSISSALNAFVPNSSSETQIKVKATCMQNVTVDLTKNPKGIEQSKSIEDVNKTEGLIETSPTPETPDSKTSPSPSASPTPKTSAKPSSSPSPSSSSTSKPSGSPSPSAKPSSSTSSAPETKSSSNLPKCEVGKTVEQELKVNPSRVLKKDLDFLTEGIWNLELTSEKEFIANSKTSSVLPFNIKEFGFIPPASLTKSALLPLTNRVDSNIAVSTSEQDVQIKVDLYNSTGANIGNGYFSVSSDKPTLITRDSLKVNENDKDYFAEFAKLTAVCKTDQKEECENQFYANSVFLNSENLSAITSHKSVLNEKSFTFNLDVVK